MIAPDTSANQAVWFWGEAQSEVLPVNPTKSTSESARRGKRNRGEEKGEKEDDSPPKKVWKCMP